MKARKISFDTLAYANRLKAVGVESKAAEEMAEANAELFSELIENNLATKQDIVELHEDQASHVSGGGMPALDAAASTPAPDLVITLAESH